MDAQLDALHTYLKLMNIVKLRYDAIRQIQLQKEYKTPYRATQIEFCVLQVRKMLEIIALGSLAANKELYRSYFEHMEKMWNGRLILRDMERVNPKFYPVPIIIDTSKEIHDFVHKTDGFLTKDEYIDVYDKCGKLLHAESPFVSDQETEAMYQAYESYLPVWCRKIVGLLSTHLIYLADGKTMLYITMQTSTDDRPSGNVFQRIDD